LGGAHPTLDYSEPPPPSSGVNNGLRIIGATVCGFTGVAGIGLLLLGVAGLVRTTFREMPEIDRQGDLVEAAVVSAIGLVVAGFSVPWFLAAVRAVRRTRVEVGPSAAEVIGASNNRGR
jgi:membrane-bound ClpP family serine protease